MDLVQDLLRCAPGLSGQVVVCDRFHACILQRTGAFAVFLVAFHVGEMVAHHFVVMHETEQVATDVAVGVFRRAIGIAVAHAEVDKKRHRRCSLVPLTVVLGVGGDFLRVYLHRLVGELHHFQAMPRGFDDGVAGHRDRGGAVFEAALRARTQRGLRLREEATLVCGHDAAFQGFEDQRGRFVKTLARFVHGDTELPVFAA